jgi:hypothetical protein
VRWNGTARIHDRRGISATWRIESGEAAYRWVGRAAAAGIVDVSSGPEFAGLLDNMPW